MKTVRIRGGSFSGLACGAALARLGWKVYLQQRPVRLPLAVVVNEPSVQLLESLFGFNANTIGYHIPRKSVRWGNTESEVSTLNEQFWVFHSHDLLNHLRARMYNSGLLVDKESSSAGVKTDWTVKCDASTSASYEPVWLSALVAFAQLSDDWDHRSLLMEDTDLGWLFIAPVGKDAAIVQAVVTGTPDQPKKALSKIIKRSTIASSAIRRYDAVNLHQIHPRLNPFVVEENVVSCGSAAFACDPISGDGIGFSSRAAILAAAAINATQLGDSKALEFYRFRLSTAYAAHSNACLDLYRSSQFAKSWQDEIQTLQATTADLTSNIRKPSRWYVLDNLALLQVGMVT